MCVCLEGCRCVSWCGSGGFEVQRQATCCPGDQGLSVCLRGNSINVWVDLLDPHLLAHSIWPKPIECLYEWIPKASMIFISMLFICISNTFSFKNLSIAGLTIMWSSPWSQLPLTSTPTAQDDELTRLVPYC